MINKLKELLEAATPGPWHFMDTPYEGYTVLDSDLGGIMSNGDYHPKKTDVKLIVAMRNCLPELLAVVEAAEGVRTSVDSSDKRANELGLWSALAALEKKVGEG